MAEVLEDHLTPDIVTEATQLALTGVMPLKAMERVKRYLRRDCRKRADLKIQYYY